jgi:hypothetical protein
MDQGRKNQLTNYRAQKPVLVETAELVRDLHELLESYAPMWFTEDINIRVSETLARLDISTNSSKKLKPQNSVRL